MAVAGASGGTPPFRYCRSNFAICAKAGAATTPPQIAPFGSSTETRITRRGREAGTTPVHADRLATDDETGLTRAFSGRLARGIRNRFMDEHPDAPIAYPEIHHATSPVRAAARKAGDADLINLWAGESYPLTRELPAAELVRRLADELDA